jgi:flagellar basal-body rod modification protein FlgD
MFREEQDLAEVVFFPFAILGRGSRQRSRHVINAISGVEVATGAQQSINDSGGLDKDAFLQLLVAQIRYQNPLEPLDGQEYLAQTAQFTMVESIEKLAEAQAESLSFHRATLSAQMLGNTVSGYDAATGQPISGTVNGVMFNAGSPQLLVDGQTVDMSSITDIRIPEKSAPDSEAIGRALALVPDQKSTELLAG